MGNITEYLAGEGLPERHEFTSRIPGALTVTSMGLLTIGLPPPLSGALALPLVVVPDHPKVEELRALYHPTSDEGVDTFQRWVMGGVGALDTVLMLLLEVGPPNRRVTLDLVFPDPDGSPGLELLARSPTFAIVSDLDAAEDEGELPDAGRIVAIDNASRAELGEILELHRRRRRQHAHHQAATS